jgi:hypothetical protein
MDFLVKRDDLHEFRVEKSKAPELGAGQALLEVDCFGLTSNNITYAVFGDAMNYWDFFPAPDGWGHVPMWGFAEVADPGDTGLERGVRVYGYLPPCSHLVVTPDRVDERGFKDGAPHLAELPSAYQAYRRVDVDPAYDAEREDEQMLFWPLFYTSFLIDDFLDDEDFFGAKTMVLSSASSKTALIAAYQLAQREGIEVIGLTSPGNIGFVEGLGVYDAAVAYDEVGGLARDRAVYVDMSGDGAVRSAVHAHYGDSLAHSAMVGMTHWDQMAAGSGGELAGPQPQMFFAPNRIKKRTVDWGAAGIDERVTDAWKPFVEWSGGWLEVRRGAGPDALKDAYVAVLGGKVEPRVGHVVHLRG